MNREIYWLVVIIVCILLGGYGYMQRLNTQNPITETTFALDTICTITVFHENDRDAMNEALNKLQEYHRLMDRHKESGLIYKLNEKGTIEYQKDVDQVIQFGLSLANDTDGKFSIYSQPLVDLWGIGSENFLRPSEAEIEVALTNIKQSSIKVDDNITIDGKLELGALAKGYIGELVKEDLKSKGVSSAIINLGGNVVLLGNKPDKSAWIVGVQSPEEVRGREVGYLSIMGNKSIISSGIYERYSEDQEGRYHHILDATTGYPIDNDLAQVTIIAENGMVGDGLSTAVFMMGLTDGMSYIESQEGIEAIFVTKDHEVFMSNAVKKWFTLTNNKFEIK